jgi:excisionase family DNA binding protein
MSERLTFTVEEAARLCGVSRGVCYAASHAGELPSVRLGSRILVPRARLWALLGEPPESSPNALEPAANRLEGKDAGGTRHGLEL